MLKGGGGERFPGCERYIGMHTNLKDLSENLPIAVMAKVHDVYKKWDPLFFRFTHLLTSVSTLTFHCFCPVREWTCLAHVLDHRYRGVTMADQMYRDTVNFLLDKAWPLLFKNDTPPTREHLLDFKVPCFPHISASAPLCLAQDLVGMFTGGNSWAKTSKPGTFCHPGNDVRRGDLRCQNCWQTSVWGAGARKGLQGVENGTGSSSARS